MYQVKDPVAEVCLNGELLKLLVMNFNLFPSVYIIFPKDVDSFEIEHKSLRGGGTPTYRCTYALTLVTNIPPKQVLAFSKKHP